MEKDLMELVNGCGVAEAEKTDKVGTARQHIKTLQYLGFKAAANKIKERVDPIVKKAQVAAGGFIEIRPEKIQLFLNRRADEYNKSRADKITQRVNDAQGFIARYTSNQDIQNAYAQLSNTLSGNLLTGDAAPQQSFSTTTNNLWNAWTTSSTTISSGGIAAYLSERPAETFYAKTVDLQSSKAGTVGRFEWTEVCVGDYPGIPPANVLETFRNVKAKKLFDYYTVASVNAVPDPLLLGRIENSTSRYFIGQWGNDVSLDDVI